MTRDEAIQLADRLDVLIGCVNARPFRDKPSGTLVFTGYDIGPPSDYSRIRLTLKHDPHGWNTPTVDGEKRLITDSVGETLYAPAIFPDMADWEYTIVEREPRG